MNEEQKLTKAKLPTKTKIAVWWLIVMGVLLTIWTFMLLSVYTLADFTERADAYTGRSYNPSWLFIPMIGSIFAIYSGIFLSKKSKNAWNVAVACPFITMICSLVGWYFFLSSLPSFDSGFYIVAIVTSVLGEPIVPFILVILDRKNYFEIVRQRELEKAQSVE